MSDQRPQSTDRRTQRRLCLARRLVAEAYAYCALIERVVAGRSRGLKRRAYAQLARLHYTAIEAKARGLRPAAVELPDVHDLFGGATVQRERAAHDALRAVLGADGRYRQIFDPLGSDDTTTECLLSVDLADTYGDIKEVLLRCETAACDDMTTASNLLTTHRLHWGRHAGDALRVLWQLDANS